MILSEHAQELEHVLWLGGSPCAGKSTVSHLLSQIYVMVDYHVDAWARAHFLRRIARGDDEAKAFLQQSVDERWLVPTVDDLVLTTQHSWMQEFPLVQARYQKQARLRVRQQRHGVYDEGSQPEQRLAQLIARDVRLADEVRRQAMRLGVCFMDVDGSRSIDECLEVVEHYYDPFLKRYFSSRHAP